MSQTVSVNFKLDIDVKRKMESACEAMGLSLSTAFAIFARKVGNERRIPFEISADPFESEVHLEMLEKRIADLKAKKNTHEHELIEEL
ncbi:type II toxin-antitoxin system RelB/DinJ family antitoxin [Succinivibrio dextrinosolvens]|uniref:type II toxin-antitoxin system RelB/DinJ family antitoxin n=1 Tax=Succinivibrio dextrinosolvens TaxID=83771 RepID=UPI00247A9F70|nr:type II toxin-antitoxin system RelB/DinJ family antitoxin [Succinivibrio dextrinosolvens]